jgi:putative Ca2+/H+ antiporter (TMEM165/GDT1 family)
MWDLRMPSGLLFTLLGIILCLMGWIYPDVRAPLAETNVNLWSGALFLAFGVLLLWMARRAS